MAAFWLIILIALGASFLCSVLEACLLSLSLADIARISEKRPLIARTWKNFKENVYRPITVILVINTLAHRIGASFAGARFQQLFGPKWITLFAVIFSFAMIQWTEILPKTLGIRYNKAVAVAALFPMKFLIYIFTPILTAVQFLNKPFESRRDKKYEMSATEDIAVLARFAAVNSMISTDQEKIVSETISLSKRKVKDVMVKKGEIKYLSTNMSLTEALIEAHLHHHTRLPLINADNKNDIVGYVNFKDIVSVLQTNPQDPSLKGIARPILEIRDNELLSVLLNRLTKGYQHIAIVKDAQGHVAGLITLEDVIEAIVGKMQDEYDILPTYFYQIAVNRYLAGGGVRLKVLREKIGTDVPDLAKSLDEWLLELFGRMPKVEDQISCKGNTFITRKVRRSNIYEVIIETGGA